MVEEQQRQKPAQYRKPSCDDQGRLEALGHGVERLDGLGGAQEVVGA